MRDGKWVSSCLPAQSNGGGYLEHSAEKDSEAESVLSETRCGLSTSVCHRGECGVATLELLFR